jgi:hypothetical protein
MYNLDLDDVLNFALRNLKSVFSTKKKKNDVLNFALRNLKSVFSKKKKKRL